MAADKDDEGGAAHGRRRGRGAAAAAPVSSDSDTLPDGPAATTRVEEPTAPAPAVVPLTGTAGAPDATIATSTPSAPEEPHRQHQPRPSSTTAAAPPHINPEPRVHYDLNLDTRDPTFLHPAATAAVDGDDDDDDDGDHHDAAARKRRHHRSDASLDAAAESQRALRTSSYDNARAPPSPSALRRRRSTRAATLTTLDDHDDFVDVAYGARPGWQPGSEPGFDPQLPDGGHASMPTLSAPCEITVVDFARDGMRKRHFDNDGFVRFIGEPKEPWAKCRWINVNGLSWDVIQAVGTNKGLHKLALEDIMNIRNRTKADWYPNHAFIIMTLQKLVHLVDDSDSDSDDSSSSSSGSSASSSAAAAGRSAWSPKRWLAWLRCCWARRRRRRQDRAGGRRADIEKHLEAAAKGPVLPDGSALEETAMLRSLQQYHASGNDARTDFMEKHSSLAPYNMAVAAEQVSIFLTNDNTVISFFEISAADVERPIVTRLSNPGTILRESCDASLLVQAIIDAVIDLALPLTAVYTDLLGDLELDVLTAPSVKQCRSLYICIAELNKMLRFLSPIDNLVNVLRDHRTPLTQDQAARTLEDPASGVIVTPMTHTYLGDVLDHCVIITEAMQQLKQSSENLINLIFNTITANQNESMKQLTTVTIIFLPLTFITGFFGQNFSEDKFPEIHNGIWYFWAVAAPTAVATILILMREMIYAWFVRFIQRRRILSSRRKSKSRRRNRRMART
ncbi:CorA family metal ion transporter [Purpureocillium lavendulum]|uniref:CorA family metal ion transporter n=1 Tax=Purpureocillium lavendulum TaxID=1247861 RepID=A0AB34FPQ8_9HYPO|nr:CorA family metal ion transporter [Purpureocillium lavendulum]